MRVLKIYPGYGAHFITIQILFILEFQVLCVHGGLSPDVRTIDQVSLSFDFWNFCTISNIGISVFSTVAFDLISYFPQSSFLYCIFTDFHFEVFPGWIKGL